MPPRIPDHPIDPLFLERWSPRAFDGSEMPDHDLLTIFEAARWAPSAFNAQPWRFLYARRGDAHWLPFLSLLIPPNEAWVRNASVLIYILSDTMIDTGKGPQPPHSHSFDAGSAWMSLALQATRLDYHAHGMSGILLDRIREELRVPDGFRIEAAAAIGRRASADILPEKLRAREAPSGRRPLGETAFAGPFPTTDPS